MGVLRRWERVIEDWERALVARVRRRGPVEVLDALRRECDGRAVVCSPSRVVVPNVYTVELADVPHRELSPYRARVGEELTDSLLRHADRCGYEWAGPVTVRIVRSAHVPNGRYRVSSSPMSHIRADALARTSPGWS
ncbi:DUF3662 domain-containing protein [Streptomyces sp. NPDC026673]|uniref:DUF3662 domain-containing protein n=1 Tax=Streptomyces sp. NPDC026673 TaxID=3155724 RepID=UPI0033D0896F